MKTHFKYSIAALKVLLYVLAVHGKGSAADLDTVPGFIPLTPGATAPASDLIYQGKAIVPEQASALHVDLSTLEPSSANDIYRPQDIQKPGERLSFDPSQSVRFIENAPSNENNFRFSASQLVPAIHGQKTFTFLVSKNIHNYLMLKALLEKLGYRVPGMKRVARLNVEFQSAPAVELFLERLSEVTLGDSKRWVSADPNDPKHLVLQDILVMSSENPIYNLALSYIPAGIISDLRIFRSLAVPYQLLDIEESVNLFGWNFSRIVSNHASLSFRTAGEFLGNYEDSRWLAKKIAKLTRNDFLSIVASAEQPPVVQKLLVEKLIARRNDMAKIFATQDTPLPVNTTITLEPDLKDGKLLRETWDGYGSRFSFSDPETPLSSSELFSFFRSKIYANAISNSVNYLNSHIFQIVDLNSAVQKKQIDSVVGQFLDFLKTGQAKKIPLQAYGIPVPGINLIASRDIVLGNYLGSDNKVQLADALGLNLSLGMYVGVLGLPTPWTASSMANASVTRTFTHLRPIQSMEAALKYPFRNALVPLVSHENAHIIDQIMAVGLSSPPTPEQQQSVQKLVQDLKDNILVGESLVIADTLGASLSIEAGAQITNLIGVYPQFVANQMLLSRVHILRSSEDTIQIYKDLGEVTKLKLSLSVKAVAPIISISGERDAGKAKVKFYTLNIANDMQVNPKLIDNLQALKELLTANDFERINTLQQPYVLNYKVSETRSDSSFLFFRGGDLKVADHIDVAQPTTLGGASVSLFRKSLGRMTGHDYQSFLSNSVNAVIAKLSGNTDILISSIDNGRPSDTVFGDSIVRQATLDVAETNHQLVQPFISVQTDWAGWEITKKDAEKILKDIYKRLGVPLYSPQILQSTNKIQLYDIRLYLNVYEDGINYFLGLDGKSVNDIFLKHPSQPLLYKRHKNHTDDDGNDELANVMDEINTISAKVAIDKAKNDIDAYATDVLGMASLAEHYLNKDGLFALFGGEQNLLIGSVINGFRTGDEGGDTPLLSNTIGEFGGLHLSGPLEQVRAQLGASNAEFYLYWLLDRL